ncbi:hypothetical protein BT10792_30945 (plasmid) [Bacillus thuringiensis]|nr:hypothetical protein BT10792_30945 [Bacillus thuringiensis]
MFSNGIVYELLEISNLYSVATNLKLKIGDMVNVLPITAHYATGEKISEFVKGNAFIVVQVKTANRSQSEYMYLLKDINS